MGALGAAAAILTGHLEKSRFMYLTFGVSWFFFYLSETSNIGGQASFFCETEEDIDDGDDDDVETRCDSDATATFFIALAFVAMLVA
eukprot:CAMPEP_0198437192 /NCGR_PEP_ID=MMETSP1452-20131203/45889_1 /TAXON_ID=1181717 /ORGANISM="Synchroma pusillum, Strain CCMP3072" /LENGTH=86 /DNA_ID=CAMNT_0044157757 /DNA_START=54 /DNA_END=311 /DNA_ORIENTATION=-